MRSEQVFKVQALDEFFFFFFSLPKQSRFGELAGRAAMDWLSKMASSVESEMSAAVT